MPDFVSSGPNGAVNERVISMWFVAFGPVGDSLVKYARKGDQLILEATAVVDDWSGPTERRYERPRF